jgi:hypothetical protein
MLPTVLFRRARGGLLIPCIFNLHDVITIDQAMHPVTALLIELAELVKQWRHTHVAYLSRLWDLPNNSDAQKLLKVYLHEQALLRVHQLRLCAGDAERRCIKCPAARQEPAKPHLKVHLTTLLSQVCAWR